MNTGIKNQVAIITGGAEGIGKATALRFAAEGVKLVLADFDDQHGEAVVKQIEQQGGEAVFVHVDVRNSALTRRMAEVALERYGKIDILVTCAGVLKMGNLDSFSEEDWDLTMDVNLKGTFLSCQAVIPAMKAQKKGVIVVISSSGIVRPSTGFSAYVASKMGVQGLMQILARELLEDNISVVAIRPSTVNTPLGRAGFLERKGRVPGEDDLKHTLNADEVAGIIAHMVNPEMTRATTTIVDTLVP